MIGWKKLLATTLLSLTFVIVMDKMGVIDKVARIL